MQYQIISMIGDFPPEGQPAWPALFDAKADAIEAARVQPASLLAKHGPDLYTMVVEEDAETAVEWIIHRGEEIDDVDRATDLADHLAE